MIGHEPRDFGVRGDRLIFASELVVHPPELREHIGARGGLFDKLRVGREHVRDLGVVADAIVQALQLVQRVAVRRRNLSCALHRRCGLDDILDELFVDRRRTLEDRDLCVVVRGGLRPRQQDLCERTRIFTRTVQALEGRKCLFVAVFGVEQPLPRRQRLRVVRHRAVVQAREFTQQIDVRRFGVLEHPREVRA